MKRLLGIDPGLAVMGFAILEIPDEDNIEIDSLKLVDFGCIETSKKNALPARLVELKQDLIEIVSPHQDDLLPEFACEQPFFGRQITSASAVLQALGVINCTLWDMFALQGNFLHQSSWKLQVLGHGRADKSESLEYARSFFDIKDKLKDDVADAINIAIAHAMGARNNIHAK